MKGDAMSRQTWETKSDVIRNEFLAAKHSHSERFKKRLSLSWSNWGFGREPLETSASRLARNKICFIELHGNHYGPDFGYAAKETLAILDGNGIEVAGICGMFSADNDLSSNRGIHRQAALDYIRRELDFAAATRATYLLVVPAAVGRPQPYDAMEFERSVETLQKVADLFASRKVRAAIEPIRSAETTIVHTVAEAKRYISAVGSDGVHFINGDVYHMQAEESHIGEAIMHREMLVNLHMADSNRCASGLGSLDLDTIIRALYLIGYNREGHYVTPEPLGPGGDPYPSMNGKPDPTSLDALVEQTARYFREREEAVLAE